MDLRELTDKDRVSYDKLVTHIMQSWQWGEFRKSFGTKLVRYGLFQDGKLVQAFQLTFHPIPLTKKYVGYFPKGPFPDQKLIQALKTIGQKQDCAFIKLEPNVERDSNTETLASLPRRSGQISRLLLRSPKPLFTKYNFLLDLTQSEEQILKNMHPKTRYNIKIAKKYGVKVEERVDEEAFEIYLKLYFQTTKRQGYHGHNQTYHRKVWQILKQAGMARLLIAFYNPPKTKQSIPLSAWMLLSFHQTLYYPYGGSSVAHKEVMANNLIAWEAILLGKRMGLKKFDMWGALGPNASSTDPWFGFHRFKQGYGGELVEYIGTYDMVFNWPIYILFTAIDKLTPLKIYLLKLLGK